MGSGRWLRLLGLRAGQPWTAAVAVLLCGVRRWWLRTAARSTKHQTVPGSVRRRGSGRRHACVCLACLRGRGGLVAADFHSVLVSYVTLASNRFAQAFCELRDTWSLLRGLQTTNTAPVLRAVDSAIVPA